MDLLEISLEDVKDFLRNRDKIKIELYDKLYTISREIRKTDDIIEMVSFQHAELSDMPKGSKKHKDLSDVYLKYQKVLDERSSEYSSLLYGYMQKENAVDRVWQCYMVLAEPYYTILTELYVKDQKYEIVELVSGYSHNAFEKHRKKAVERVLELYNSNKSMSELGTYALKAERVRNQVKHKQAFEEKNYQMSLNEILGGN